MTRDPATVEIVQYPQTGPTILQCDNNGTVDFTHDPHGHTRMKHIDIRAHFIRNQVNSGTIDVIRISGKENPADVFTKSLARVLHANALRMLGVNAGQGGVSDDAPPPIPIGKKGA